MNSTHLSFRKYAFLIITRNYDNKVGCIHGLLWIRMWFVGCQLFTDQIFCRLQHGEGIGFQ